jgi:hypothetical protein
LKFDYPINPINPTNPINPIKPTNPINPTNPTNLIQFNSINIITASLHSHRVFFSKESVGFRGLGGLRGILHRDGGL